MIIIKLKIRFRITPSLVIFGIINLVAGSFPKRAECNLFKNLSKMKN